MPDQDNARLAELEAENSRLNQQLADFAEHQRRELSARIHADHLHFAEDLIKQGRLLPAMKDVAVATLDHLAAAETAIEFGEGDGKKPLLDAVKSDIFAAMPKMIEFGEHYAGPASTINPNDAESIKKAAEAYQFSESQNGRTISSAEAVAYITRSNT